MIPRGASAVMAQRREPPTSLDYFPTPPWATRAFLRHVLPVEDSAAPAWPGRSHLSAWEPACGAGHMAAVLAEGFATVEASDVFPYGFGEVRDFLADGLFELAAPRADWIITNPPFNEAAAFAQKALARAVRGVALLVRTAWLESEARWQLFRRHVPTSVWQYAERVPMRRGYWDPRQSTATAYCWVVWRLPTAAHAQPLARLQWIPPGNRAALSLPKDLAFAGAGAIALPDLLGEAN